jgi:mannosyl-oligosaccharide alpha-1,2-mannosidase
MLHDQRVAREAAYSSLTTDLKSLRGLIRHLMYISKSRNLLYVTDVSRGKPSGKMEHLSCFFPGLIALGLHTLPDSIYESADEKLIFQYAAEGLAHTCWVLYADQATGVGPELVTFEPYSSGKWDYDDWESGRWIHHVNEWIEQGKPDGKLKGVHDLSPPRRGELELPLDYEYQNPAYFLRPEVRFQLRLGYLC